MTETTYAYWIHTKSGCLYAIRPEDDAVTGCCGPVNYYHATRDGLPDYHYDDQPGDAAWVRDNDVDFSLYEGDLPHG
jgi:hypothetical protein